jgi:hypothetical protein
MGKNKSGRREREEGKETRERKEVIGVTHEK